MTATTIAGARNWVEVPGPAPKPYGALSGVLTVVDTTDPHSMLGAEYQTDACFSVNEWLTNCGNYPKTPCDQVPPTDHVKKQFHGLSLVQGDPFTLYDGIVCEVPGNPVDHLEERARAALTLKEARGVEKRLTALLTTLAAATGGPLAATSVADSIAKIEGWLEDAYGGLGVVAMSRRTAVHAVKDSLIGVEGGRLYTAVGTPVVLGVGDADTMFGSGQITLLRGQVMVMSVPEMNIGATCLPARTLAERTYVPLIECGAVNATITPTP